MRAALVEHAGLFAMEEVERIMGTELVRYSLVPGQAP